MSQEKSIQIENEKNTLNKVVSQIIKGLATIVSYVFL